MTTTLLLALVPIVSESDIGLREVYESASAALELRPSLELLSDESLFVLGGPQQPVLECGSDLACLSRHLERLEADLGLVIVVSRAGPQHLIDLRLIRTEVASLIITRRHAHSPAEGPMTEALASRIAQLFDAAGFHRVSRLTVTVSPDTARVWLDGTPLDLRDAIIPPGTHVIRAAAEGYLESERSVEVAPGASTEISLSLEAEPSLLTSWWLWTVVGVVAAAGATTAIALATRPSSEEGQPMYFCAMRRGAAGCDRM